MQSTDCSHPALSIYTILRRFLFACLVVLLCSFTVHAEGDALYDSEEQSPYKLHGALHTLGAVLADSYDQPVQLHSVNLDVSSHPEYITAETFGTLKSFDIDTIRLLVTPGGENGYLSSDDSSKEALRQQLVYASQYAGDLGMYLIIGWDISNEADLYSTAEAAENFFINISESLRDFPFVLYEVCSNPSGDASWDAIRYQSNLVIPAIRSNAPEAVVFVGTPLGSDGSFAAYASPLEQSNILYSLSINASYEDRNAIQNAANTLSLDFPFFVGRLYFESYDESAESYTENAGQWIELFNQYNIGYSLSWLSNDSNPLSFLSPYCNTLSDWTDDNLSTTGRWYLETLSSVSEAYSEASVYSTGVPAEPSSSTWALSNGCVVDVLVSAAWFDGTYNFSEYDIQIANPTPNAISNWRIRLTWSAPVYLQDSWSCEIGGSDSSRLVIPLEYNKVIAADSSINFGLVTYGEEVPNLLAITVE